MRRIKESAGAVLAMAGKRRDAPPLLLAAVLVAGCADDIGAIVPPGPCRSREDVLRIRSADGKTDQRPRLVYIYGGRDGTSLEQLIGANIEIRRLVGEFYMPIVLPLSWDYDDTEFRGYWARQSYADIVPYSQYLTIKNNPFTSNDLCVIREFQVVLTPKVLICDRTGTIVAEYGGSISTRAKDVAEFRTFLSIHTQSGEQRP